MSAIVKLIFILCIFTASLSDSMDHKAREKAWLTKLDELFGGESPAVPSTRETGDVITRLKNLYNRKTRIWWNKSFLERYIDKGLILRGLRVQVFPSFSIDDESFKKEWEDCATACSRGFMGLLIKSNAVSLSELEIEINAIQVELSNKLSNEAMMKLNKELESDFAKWEKEIVASKSKKYQRDSLDFSNSRVYRWRKKQAVPSTTPRFHRNSFSSVSSMDEEVPTGSHSIVQQNSRLGLGKHAYRKGSTYNKRKLTPPQSLEKKSKTTTNLEVINLSGHVLSKSQEEVLKLGLTFVPTNGFDYFVAMKDLQLFLRKVVLRKLHARPTGTDGLDTTMDRETLAILEELESEGATPVQVT
ncbi:uncharacterized protein [Ranitomeya imitator]|uniref:uncharacterized protein isoform X2 n=1 Tax=Ranitomeya imitator TaxID=111125 RepID=UPI0037E95CA3